MADEPIPVIPTLHDISNPVLTKLSDQIAYIVRWYFANPGGTSSCNEDELISFRKLNSMHGRNPSQMCGAVADALEKICHRFTDDVKVECSYEQDYHRDPEEIDPLTGQGVLQGTYKMEIRITTANGEPIIPHSTVKILKNGDAIDLKFKQR